MPAWDDDLTLPFFDDAHRTLARELDAWCARSLSAQPHAPGADVDADCRALVRQLGEAGWLRYCVPRAYGGALDQLDSRALCLLRETLARHDGLADFAFAMQGLGSGAITLAGDETLRQRYLPRVARGEAIAAFALSEPEAGSDVAAMRCRATLDGDHYVLDGTKTWISNGGIADFYCVFARTGEAPGARGITAFVVDADTPGLQIAERIDVMAPHPLATLRFDGCRVPAAQRLGEPGQGFKLAMMTLDIFRASVAAAALGFGRAALDEAIARATARPMFGGKLADLQLTQAALGEMATALDAAALLTWRAAWLRDTGAGRSQGGTQGGAPVRTTREAAMAKMTATENAQMVIDRAVQLFGGLGVRIGSRVESLYREIRSLRIYEGATEVQKLIVARETLAARQPRS
ncbi:acyl-CoA dehydrogenase family protein [Cupriavidus gilardii]|uniref:Acyl-CoA dehydrogenase family protein n=1 Tax=Cupriavidus gilardii TaxID=82541 RepID=A0ABY4VVH7_9BURK|nr:acyl-CoA dehydrogenase family protein [Cupriavidus gilardii]USE81214.1 acyl-CoA dehydrogenase family protein [Cupriavidus gilardii]